METPEINLTLTGKSRSSDATGFLIPELKIHLDTGLIASNKYHYEVFITHTHSDHAHTLPYYATRHIPREAKPTNIYVS